MAEYIWTPETFSIFILKPIVETIVLLLFINITISHAADVQLLFGKQPKTLQKKSQNLCLYIYAFLYYQKHKIHILE